MAGCATVTPTPQVIDSRTASAAQAQTASPAPVAPVASLKVLKRKIAIGRFSNETRYGRTFVTDDSHDPLGKQASDILTSRLIASNEFLVFERPDLNKIAAEQAIGKDSNLIGVDTLVIGSVTEFGRSTTGKSGFLSATKIQHAHAKVELRLVDVKTGSAFFSASGTGDASSESGEIAGFGSRADYDGSLNDKAIAAAISDVIGRMMTSLKTRPWRTDILKVEGNTLYISGGAAQGIHPGDTLHVYRSGDAIKSQQSGFVVSLPPTQIATVRISSNFGDSEANEGSVAVVTAGALPAQAAQTTPLFIAE